MAPESSSDHRVAWSAPFRSLFPDWRFNSQSGLRDHRSAECLAPKAEARPLLLTALDALGQGGTPPA